MALQVQSRPEAQPGSGSWHQQGLPRRAAALAEAGFQDPNGTHGVGDLACCCLVCARLLGSNIVWAGLCWDASCMLLHLQSPELALQEQHTRSNRSAQAAGCKWCCSHGLGGEASTHQASGPTSARVRPVLSS